MAKINLVQDIVIPAAVGGAEIAMDAWDTSRKATNAAATPYAPYTGLVLAVLGLAMVMGNMRVDDAKPLAHAALPSATKQIYGWVKTAITPATTGRAAPAAAVVQRVAAVGRYPAPAYAGDNFNSLRME